ncbi:DUF998 domain-containing protein [Leucobacter iarius]|uniref:DUF998 domain-containing protein n=1 Tax=Leucobacter iarius TaxID=333963 RepID=UPI0031D8E99C
MTVQIPSTRTTRARRALTAAAALALAAALAIIWAGRLLIERPVYVSELGAEEPTARWFKYALLLIVFGGLVVAWSARGVRLRRWDAMLLRPAALLAISSACFFVASQEPCTSGCPIPFADEIRWQDLVHTSSAVVAFGAAALAMLAVAGSDADRSLRHGSLAAAGSVAVIAATGGIFSLLRFRTDIGGLLEFVATSIGVLWLLWFGLRVQSRSGHRRSTASSTSA